MSFGDRMADRIKKAAGTTKQFDTKVIAGFPGIGKSECTRRNPSFLDSDSSLFSWMYDASGCAIVDADGAKIRNPDFPGNYIAHIKSVIGRVPAVFVSSHKDVRKALEDAGLIFNLVYPDVSLKEEYLQRYVGRGNDLAFVEMISKKWDEFIGELDSQMGCHKIILQKEEFLVDVMDRTNGISSELDAPGVDNFCYPTP